MFKYEPSAGALDGTYQRLLKLRTELQEEYRQASHDNSWRMFEDVLEERERDIKVAKLRSKLDLVEDLLRPFEREARDEWDWYQRRACDRMMHL